MKKRYECLGLQGITENESLKEFVADCFGYAVPGYGCNYLHRGFEDYIEFLYCMQDILTILVALTLIPQQGQMYFLVLEVLPVPGMLGAPLWVPVPPIWKPVNSFLFRRMSVNPFFRTNSRRLSEGEVFVQPYFLSWSIKSPCASAEALKCLLW